MQSLAVRTQINTLSLLAGLLFLSSAMAQNEISAPVARFSFDGNDPRLEIERGKIDLVDGGIRGKALRTGDPENKIFWRMPSSGFDWKKGSISFWFKPIDWKQEGRLHHWLHTVSSKTGTSFNLHICNANSGKSQFLFFGIQDTKRNRMHAWNGFTDWKNDQWYFVTATWGPQTASLYLNGECDTAGGGLRPTPDLSIVPGMFENAALYIGAQNVNCWDGKKYSGVETSLMDELELRQEQLSDEQVRQLYYSQRPADSKKAVIENTHALPLPVPERSRLLVPSNASAPRIDGSLSDGEWADAVSFTGLIETETGVLSDRQFTGYLKSDGKKLYFAFRMKVHDSEQLIHERTARDSEVYLDDSWELYLYPGATGSSFYQLVVNKLGTIFDQSENGIGWNGRWEIKQNFGGRESQAPDLWEAELAIPLEDLGQTGDIEKTAWRFGFFINQKTPEVKSFGWTAQKGMFSQPDKACILKFVKNGSCINLTSLGSPSVGAVTPAVTFVGKPQKTIISLQLQSGETISKFLEESGKAVAFPPMRGKGQAIFRISAPADSTPEQSDFYYSAILGYDSIPVAIKSKNYPSRKELCLELNYGAFEDQGNVKQYLIEFGKHSKSFQRKSQIPWEKINLSTSDVSPGEYNIEVSLADSAGKKLATQKLAYTKEGNEPWLNNTIGIIKDYVPSPYTPMQIKGRTVEISGRKITLSETGLPEQIESKGISLLKNPVKLEAVCDGKKVSMKASSAFKFENIQRDDSLGTAVVTLGPWEGSLTQTVSFDGFCWYEINLHSAAQVTAQDMAIEIRLPNELARSYQLAGVDFKKTQLSLEESLGDVLAGNMSLGFTPQVWLGNEEAGLAWLAESYKGWQVSNDRKIIEIIHENDAVLLRINIIDEPVKLSGQLNLAFGLQASPVKPITERMQHCMWGPGVYEDMLPQTNVYGAYCGNDSSSPLYAMYCGLPEPARPEQCLKEAERQKKTSCNVTPYSTLTWLSLGVSEMKIYGGDWYLGQPWSSTAGLNANPEPIGLCDTEDKNYQDFMVWRFVNLWNAYGGSSVYYDLFSPHQNTSPEHNKGYTTRTGETAYPFPIRSVREISRRLYIAYHQKNPDFACFANAGGGFWLPLVGFIDACCGQHTENVDKYPEMLTYDRYRSCFLGYPIGVKTLFLPNLNSPARVAKMEMSHYLAGIILNHNTTMWSCFIDRAAVDPYFRIYHGKDEWPVQRFLPYWKYPNLTTLDPNKFKVSGWYNEKARKGLLCIASLSAEPVRVPVSLGNDWTFRDVTKPADACKTMKGWMQTYPSGQTALVGDYSCYLSSGKLGSTFDKGVAVFKPYGILMLEIK